MLSSEMSSCFPQTYSWGTCEDAPGAPAVHAEGDDGEAGLTVSSQDEGLAGLSTYPLWQSSQAKSVGVNVTSRLFLCVYWRASYFFVNMWRETKLVSAALLHDVGDHRLWWIGLAEI